MDASANPLTHPENDQFGAGGVPGPNGRRDVHIGMEVWDDMGTASAADDVNLLGPGNRFDDPTGRNAIPALRTTTSRLYYKAVFVNEWDDAATRPTYPLDVTPFLDDVTVTYAGPSGPRVMGWSDGDGD